MIHKGRVKDPSRKVSPPGPTYMSDDQVASYLKQLRSGPPSRPSGSRPFPSHAAASPPKSRDELPPRAASALSMNKRDSSSSENLDHIQDPYPRSASAMSHNRQSLQFGSAGRPLVQQPSAYRVSGNLSPDAKIAPSGTPSGMYRESGQRWMERQEARSLRDALEEMDLQEEERLYSNAQDEATRLVWEHQNPGAAYKNPHAAYANPDLQSNNRFRQHLEKASLSRRQSEGASVDVSHRHKKNMSGPESSGEASSPDSYNESLPNTSFKKKGRVNFALPPDESAPTVRDKLPKSRSVSSESSKGIFRNPEDSIYEEPEEPSNEAETQRPPAPAPSALRVKPRNSLPQEFSSTPARFRNSPFDRKQNKVDIYKNPPTQSRNPLYTTNSSTPQPSEPKKEEPTSTKDGLEVRSDDIRAATSMKFKDRSGKLPMPTAVSDRLGQPIVSFDPSWKPQNETPKAHDNSPAVPAINVSEPPAVPTINLPDESNEQSPSIVVSAVEEANKNADSRPASTSSNSRKSVDPKRMAPTSQSKWYSPFTRSGVPTATCANCTLPIEGRIVTAAGSRFHPECFSCFHCGTGLECVAFYQEPEATRNERLANASHDDIEANALRFYCHLDFHELFSPRCKSCKTPIEGEVVVACGAEWHVGHFFCAECGDPFNQETPFVEKDGFAWCLRCHSRRTASRCLGCKQPVMEDVVVTALDGQWHDKCFVCHECGGDFGPEGRFFVKEGEPRRTTKGRIIGGPVQLAVCEPCEARRLKA
ncbi:LIM domain protein [Talaromyces proteolyticus]|uniref:LIM domain protein n=1 Tax=Talaromyces proteolyticus TaxID=1131652 RepID=A0AAD4KRY0_9EURO|nr:LIM domain protein [Talaromyces proteolyticus]KAH8697498.1 LIM domain protein [Talaromyces proteolyticus]